MMLTSVALTFPSLRSPFQTDSASTSTKKKCKGEIRIKAELYAPSWVREGGVVGEWIGVEVVHKEDGEDGDEE